MCLIISGYDGLAWGEVIGGYCEVNVIPGDVFLAGQFGKGGGGWQKGRPEETIHCWKLDLTSPPRSTTSQATYVLGKNKK